MIRFRRIDDAVRSGNEDRIRFWVNDLDNHLHSIGQALGFSYEQGAVIPDGTPRRRPSHARTTRRPTGPAAASRTCGSTCARKHSTLDWFDKDFTVVAGPLGRRLARSRPRRSPKRPGCRSIVQQLPNAHPADGIHMGLRGAVLVRPDGHVAWRMPYIPSDPARELAGALANGVALAMEQDRSQRHVDRLQAQRQRAAAVAAARRRSRSFHVRCLRRAACGAFHRHRL